MKTRLHKVAHTHPPPNKCVATHTHTEKAKFKYPNDFSSDCLTQTHTRRQTTFRSFSLTLICLCIKIRRVEACVESRPHLSSHSPQLCTSANHGPELTHMPSLCRPPAQTVCRSPRATWDVLKDVGSLRNKHGASWKIIFKSSHWVEETHCISEFLCNLVGLLRQTGKYPKDRQSYSRSSRHQRRSCVNSRGNKKETARSFMAPSCVDLMFLGPGVHVCLCGVFMPVPQRKKWNSL